MGDRSFHIRRSYRPKFLFAAIGVALVLMGFLLRGSTGESLLIALGMGAIGAAFALQYRPGVEYVLGAQGLLLRRGAMREELPLEQLLDANVVDMDTARNYARQHAHAAEEGRWSRSGSHDPLTRYCSIPLKELPVLGSARLGVDPQGARRSMVLLRIRDGRSLLLSPRHSESMASAISKALRTEVTAA